MMGVDFSMESIILIVVLVLLFVLYGLYVKLIQKKNKVKEAIGGVDVQLNKRYDLITNILFIANKFMEHERNLMEDITKLRTQAVSLKATPDTISQKVNLDNEIVSKMGELFVNVENYPQLKSNETMVQAMQTYSEVEEHIAAARRFYNSAVNDLNNAVEIFPSSVIAGLMGITPCPFYEAPETARTAVNASDYLK
jgi:LemA protein